MTVRNVQNMKCELNGTVNMMLQNGETVKLNEVLYLPEALKNLPRILAVVEKDLLWGILNTR